MISVQSRHFETKEREGRRIIYFIAKKGRGGREGGRGERRGRKEGRSVK